MTARFQGDRTDSPVRDWPAPTQDLVAAFRGLLTQPGERPHPGLFVTFEGGDGSGKTTQIALFADALKAAGIPVLTTREPGGTELGQELRRLVMHGPEDVDPYTEALLYAADRAYHVATLVRPALAGGTVVLEDRYTDSSVAYQGAARRLGAEEVRSLSDWATAGLTPDVTLLFDVDPQVGMQRTGGDLDRLERSGEQFHERVRESYLAMAAAEPERFVVVDAGGEVRRVFASAADALSRHLADWTAKLSRHEDGCT